MTTAYNNRQCAHVWAQRNQPRGKGYGNIFFEGDVIYSYGYHFPIATWVDAPNGEAFVAFTTEGSSVTTAKHCSYVRSAIPGGVRIIRTAHPLTLADGVANMERIRDEHQERINQALLKASRARTYKKFHLEDAARAANDMNWLAAAYSRPDLRVSLPDDMEAALADARKLADRLSAEQRERKAESRRLQQVADHDKFYAWYERGVGYCPPSYKPEDGSHLLALAGDEVVTSGSARVPVDHARRLWPMLLAARQRVNGEPVRLDLHVGHFTVSSMDSFGITAGCHRIAWTEVERMAGVLGLTE